MIKFSAHDRESGLPVLGIGLSRENCDLLLAGRPIIFATSAMGLPEMEIFIMAGETEEAMVATVIRSGAIRPEQIHEDGSLAEPHTKVHSVDFDKGAN